MKTEIFYVNGSTYTVKIYFEQRKSARASIGKNTINIRMPISLSREQQFREIRELKKWAEQKILEKPEKFKPEPLKEYKNSDTITVGDQTYRLDIEFANKASSSARIIQNTIYFSIAASLSTQHKSKHICTLLSRCIARKRLPELKEKINTLNQQHFQQPIKKIFFKHNTSNWGSCSENGNINISTRLLFAPNEVLEYVCIHELAHLIHQNHSPPFWECVEKAMPNYQKKIQWLKQNGSTCKF